MSDMTTKINSDILKIGWYQIIGGGIGELFVLYSLFSPMQISRLEVLSSVFTLLLFGYSIFCGILCIKHKENALTYSFVNQILQLISFAFLGFAFTYVAGFYISVGFDFSNILAKFNFGFSTFGFNINREYDRTEIYFNLVALGVLFWINKLSRKIEAEKANIEFLSTQN